MATIAVLKRSSRLRSRDHSIKISSETKCKPRKVTTANKNIQKINVSARKLRPRQKKNYYDDSKLLQKYVPTKQHDSVVILEKLDLDNKKIPVYKTLKSEKCLEEKSDIYDFKFDPNDIREKPKKKKGKPKKKNVNKPGNKMTKNKTRFKKKMELSKLEIQTIKGSKSKKDKDIYLNKIEAPRIDTDIHITKKLKNDMNQIKIPEIGTNVQTIEEIYSKENIEAIEASRIEIDVQKAKESIKKTIDEGETLQTDSIIQDIGETTLPEETFMNQNRKQDVKKPKIVSIENADNIVVAKTYSNVTVQDKVFRPFRPKNIFDNKISDRQPKNILNSSSLIKSLSPITRISNNLDFESPWRPPTFPMFSQAKHFVQSTPNVSMEINNENLENMEQDKENLKMNKKNKHRKNKEKKQKFYKKRVILEQVLTNENPHKIQPVLASKQTIEQSAPCRISLGKLRTLCQEKPDNNEDDKQVMNEVQTEAVKSFETQKEKHLVNYLNFSDTFDVMSETERLSNVDNNIPLFFDLEPSYFSKVFIIKIYLYISLL